MAVRKQLERSQQPFDPNNLPHKSMQPNRNNKPKLTEKAFADAGLVNNPLVQYASHGGFTYGNLAGASNPAYLTETDEVKLTDAIKAKALELNHDPVKIYNWVHNNIEWIPSWGAMQDSDITLGSKRGNSMDISSLLIALYRAFGILARYVHGTIEVPAEKFRNWAGGFESTEAAADFASSGGIPTGIGIEGGVPSVVQLEHIWVEAAIDYLPSRGAINKDADSWVQMDASYKQYVFQKGLDLKTIVTIDPVALSQQFVDGSTVNNTERWFSNLDYASVQNSLDSTDSQLDTYIASQPAESITPKDILGGQDVVAKESKQLPTSLANNIITVGSSYGQLPAALKFQFKISLGLDQLGQSTHEKIIPWSIMNSRRLSISFSPATEADKNVLETYFTNGEKDISQVAGSIPAYLIKVVPELKLDGITILTGSQVSLGEQIKVAYTISAPGFATNHNVINVSAGSYLSLVTIGGSISVTVLANIEKETKRLTSILESNDPNLISQLSREEMFAQTYYKGLFAYFSQYKLVTYLLEIQRSVRQEILPSMGSFGYIPNVSYFFGLPYSVNPGAVEMDITDINLFTADKNYNQKNRVSYVQQTGLLLSALEHQVPEMFFVTDDLPGEAVSAVKALTRAALEGQRTYNINKDNINTVIANINQNTYMMQDIQNAVNSGFEVVTHTDPVSISGWNGGGYIILDPETGSGAYKISNGTNGGYIHDALERNNKAIIGNAPFAFAVKFIKSGFKDAEGLCLTQIQKKSFLDAMYKLSYLKDAILALEVLTPFLEETPAGMVTMLGIALGLLIMLHMIVRLHNINKTLNEAGVSGYNC